MRSGASSSFAAWCGRGTRRAGGGGGEKRAERPSSAMRAPNLPSSEGDLSPKKKKRRNEEGTLAERTRGDTRRSNTRAASPRPGRSRPRRPRPGRATLLAAEFAPLLPPITARAPRPRAARGSARFARMRRCQHLEPGEELRLELLQLAAPVGEAALLLLLVLGERGTRAARGGAETGDAEWWRGPRSALSPYRARARRASILR